MCVYVNARNVVIYISVGWLARKRNCRVPSNEEKSFSSFYVSASKRIFILENNIPSHFFFGS